MTKRKWSRSIIRFPDHTPARSGKNILKKFITTIIIRGEGRERTIRDRCDSFTPPPSSLRPLEWIYRHLPFMYEDPIWDRSRCDFNKLRIHYAIVVIRGTNFLSLSLSERLIFLRKKKLVSKSIERETRLNPETLHAGQRVIRNRLLLPLPLSS